MPPTPETPAADPQPDKAQSIRSSLGHGGRGFFWALSSERAFQRQLAGSLALLAVAGLSSAPLLWWVLAALTGVMVLTFELFNCALEVSLDLLHPERHEAVGLAKDLACAAVLCANLGQAIVGLAMIGLRLKAGP